METLKKSRQKLLATALLAVAAYFGARHSDFDFAIFLDLFFQFFVELGFKLTHFSALQTRDVNVIAGAVAFVEMLVAAQVEQIEFVDQAVALQQIQRSVHRYAMHARIEFLRALQDRSRIQMALGIVHDFEQNFSLARQSHAAFLESGLQTARSFMRVDALSGGNSMCGSGHELVRKIRGARTRAFSILLFTLHSESFQYGVD